MSGAVASFPDALRVGSQNHQGTRQLVDAHAAPEGWAEGVHTPPHLLRNETWYLISACTWQRRRFFSERQIAQSVCELIDRDFSNAKWVVKAYVVMPDHYHVVTKSHVGRDLPEIIRKMHGRASAVIRKTLTGRGEVPPHSYFNNYWDVCLNTEADWLYALEYVRRNPLNLEWVETPERYPFLCLRH